MFGTIILILAFVVLTIAVAGALVIKKMPYKRGRSLNSFNILLTGIVIASVLMFLPIYGQLFETGRYGIAKTLLLSLHNTIRLFVVDGEFSIILDSMKVIPENIRDVYIILAATLFVVAPFLTFGFVLSFFKNVSAYESYYMNYFSEMYVFSELNERSIELAKSLKKNNCRRCIVFTDVFETEDEITYELIVEAKEVGAILFKKDISVVNFSAHSKKSKVTFFIIGEDDNENINQTFSLIKRYKKYDNMAIYVFTMSVNSELLLGKPYDGKIKLRRINEVQSLINRNLFDNGIGIFEGAVQNEGKEKDISALIIGMDQYGIEMTKSLSWFCQMDGYRVRIHAVDKNENTKEKFTYECPELMDEKHNHDFKTKGEAHYSIDIYSGVHVESKHFLNMLEEILPVTYVFISTGDDERNIRLAVKLRSWFLRQGLFPRIDAIVKSSGKKIALEGVTNYSGQRYDINFIGDTYSSYSEEVIFDSDVEKEALERHLKWGKEEEFWRYEYNYRASVAAAIHKKMRVLCGIPGAEKSISERSEEELKKLRVLEHCRWNAYMRSEGFSYAEKRNNLAKTHHCLVPFDELSLEEQEKDDV